MMSFIKDLVEFFIDIESRDASDILKKTDPIIIRLPHCVKWKYKSNLLFSYQTSIKQHENKLLHLVTLG